MLRLFRKAFVILLALITSFVLLVSIPLMNLWIKGDLGPKKYTKTAISMVAPQQLEQKQKPSKQLRQPKRPTTTQRNVKAGPRFAMDLGVAGGAGGAAISTDLLKAAGGGSQSMASGDVDEKPSMRGAPAFQAPQAIRESEIDARLRLSFCVDANGKPYDIRVLEESPSGKGLGEAGKQALARAAFDPARKDGNAVPFCGLEQPFEIKFRD